MTAPGLVHDIATAIASGAGARAHIIASRGLMDGPDAALRPGEAGSA